MRMFEYQKKISYDAWLVFLISVVAFTLCLFDHEFIQFEARFGLFAQEMLRSGIQFFPTQK